MKTRIFTYVECVCGHRGALIETIDTDEFRRGIHHAWLRELVSAGSYNGDDPLFAMLKPTCSMCDRSLSPDNIVGRSELQGLAEVLRLKSDASASGITEEIRI